MTDAEVLAKVRQAAERTIEAHEYAQESHRSAATLARVALAMVVEFEWNQREQESCTMTAAQHLSNAQKVFGVAARSTYAERYSCMATAHSEAASRILYALRVAVGG